VKKARPAAVFLVLGLAFITLGISVNRGFLAAGLAFMVIGIVRRRREGSS
jgi:hypothetical protein